MVANKSKFNTRTKGFSLIELLVVLLLISIMCQTGITMFSNMSGDASLITINSEINAFFVACRNNAKMRQIPLTIVLNQQSLYVAEDKNIFLKLNNVKFLNFPDSLRFSEAGDFMVNGDKIQSLTLPLSINNGSDVSVTINI